MRLNTAVVKALDMPTVCHDSRQQPPLSKRQQPWTLTGRRTPPRKIFLLLTVKLDQHNSRIAPPYHGTPTKSIRLMMISLTLKKAMKPERKKNNDEQSAVRNGNTIGENESNQTDDQQSDVRNGNTAGENRSNHTDDQQPEVQYGHEAGENEAVSQFTIIEQQTDLLDFPYSVAHCNSANLKLGAGLAKQIKEKFTSYFPPKNEKATSTARTVLG